MGHIILYAVLNRVPFAMCDRSYLPLPDMKQLLNLKDKPLFAVESKTSLNRFDLLAFSIAYELGAVNCLEMLSQAKVPLTWRERLNDSESKWSVEENNSHPLIFAGGPTATSNPEPFSDFFDFFAIGDGD